MTYFYIFGYGSLIWRPDFKFAERKWARLRHYKRRFWQGSADHRGTPENPGRVVTLLEETGAEVWGVVYKIHLDDKQDILEYLHIREIGGYLLLEKDVESKDGQHVSAYVFIATTENGWYLGESVLEEMAEQIASSEGKSGRNRDYLRRLREELEKEGILDAHVRDLDDAVRKVLAQME